MQRRVSFSPMMYGVSERQELINKHSLCLGRLRRAADEADSLRRENEALQLLNVELGKKLRYLIQSSLSQDHLDSQRTTLTPMVVCGGETERRRLPLPKSISVKTEEYLKTTDNGRRNRTSSRSRTNEAQNNVKVLVVKRGKRCDNDDGGVEIEVTSQGSKKTELCEKWRESDGGDCPYGSHCRYAHGVDELRPVIRHPRYKTELCRMVVAGVACPYGHRCHFLHSLSPITTHTNY